MKKIVIIILILICCVILSFSYAYRLYTTSEMEVITFNKTFESYYKKTIYRS